MLELPIKPSNIPMRPEKERFIPPKIKQIVDYVDWDNVNPNVPIKGVFCDFKMPEGEVEFVCCQEQVHTEVLIQHEFNKNWPKASYDEEHEYPMKGYKKSSPVGVRLESLESHHQFLIECRVSRNAAGQAPTIVIWLDYILNNLCKYFEEKLTPIQPLEFTISIIGGGAKDIRNVQIKSHHLGYEKRAKLIQMINERIKHFN